LRPDDTPKYLNSPDTLLYDKSKILYGLSWAKQHLLDQQYLILVEGYMDVIGLAKLGIGT
jgi:DNA primase